MQSITVEDMNVRKVTKILYVLEMNQNASIDLKIWD